MLMMALPEAASPAVTLVADGGTLGGSPGRDGIYWSVADDRGRVLRRRDASGKRRWSDEAEFLALISALRMARTTCQPGDVALVRMDCRSVINLVARGRSPRAPRLRPLYWLVQQLIERANEAGIHVCLSWTGRKEVVRVLGH